MTKRTAYLISCLPGLRVLCRAYCVVVVVGMLSGAVTAAAQEAEEPQTREVHILNVDRLEQVVEDGETIRRLIGNVQLRQDSTYLQSERAVQYLDREEIYFFGDVVITDRGDSLRADTVFYNQQTKVGEARGAVEFYDGDVRVLAPLGRHHTEEKWTEFSQGVMLVDSLTTLTSWEGEYFSEEERAEFFHDVKLHRPWSYLESDSITYYRDLEVSLARGDVIIERWEEVEEGTPPDSVSRTFLLGERAYNDEQAGTSRMEGQSLAMQLRYDHDGAEVDTLIMRSDRIDALERDEGNRITAVGNVRSWRNDFAAVADSVVYDRYEQSVGPLEEPPPLLAQATVPTGSHASSSEEHEGGLGRHDADTVDLPTASLDPAEQGEEPPRADPIISIGIIPELDAVVPATPVEREPWLYPRLGEILWEHRVNLAEDSLFVAEEDTVEEVRLFRDPIAWFEQSQVTADSIRVRTGGTPVDSIFARGNVFIAQLDSVTERIHQLKGQNLAGTSVNDSLRTFAISPNAEAIYHRTNENNEPDGALQALGDESLFRFVGEELRYIHFTPRIEGYFYEEEHMTEPLRLSGFIWVPEQRPEKQSLLSEDAAQEERIVRLLTTYPPLPERAPEAPSERGQAPALPPETAQPPDSDEDGGHLLPRRLRSDADQK